MHCATYYRTGSDIKFILIDLHSIATLSHSVSRWVQRPRILTGIASMRKLPIVSACPQIFIIIIIIY